MTTKPPTPFNLPSAVSGIGNSYRGVHETALRWAYSGWGPKVDDNAGDIGILSA